jgi:hypothetical protein
MRRLVGDTFGTEAKFTLFFNDITFCYIHTGILSI